MTDAELEAQINAAYLTLIHSRTPEEMRASFAVMRDLIRQRSPEQIERMEREKGLR